MANYFLNLSISFYICKIGIIPTIVVRIKGDNECKVLSGTGVNKYNLYYESHEIELVAKDKEGIFAGGMVKGNEGCSMRLILGCHLLKLDCSLALLL